MTKTIQFWMFLAIRFWRNHPILDDFIFLDGEINHPISDVSYHPFLDDLSNHSSLDDFSHPVLDDDIKFKQPSTFG